MWVQATVALADRYDSESHSWAAKNKTQSMSCPLIIDLSIYECNGTSTLADREWGGYSLWLLKKKHAEKCFSTTVGVYRISYRKQHHRLNTFVKFVFAL